MNERDLLLWLIPGFGSVMSMVGLGVFGQLRQMSVTLQSLAVDMAKIAEKVDSHEKRIDRLEQKD